MTGEIEAVADVATGTLAAHAVDGGEVGGHGRGNCLNCGEKLTGPYCHACGQAAHTHRTLMGFGHDILHGVFHFEGRFWHTIPLLVAKPGELTRRYINGERIRFISPVALFLFMVFLTFAVLNFGPGVDVNTGIRTAAHKTEIANTQAEIRTLEVARRTKLADGQGADAIDAQLNAKRETLEQLRAGQIVTDGALDPGFEAEMHTGVKPIDKVIHKVAQNPNLFVYKLQSSAYKFLWLLIPISLPFIWLMFAWRRDVALYDHAVFATYSLSAMMLLMIVLHLLSLIGLPDVIGNWALVLAPPFHMYRQLRGAYGVSRFGGLWRVAFLLVSAGISSVIFALVLIQMMMGQ